jgi:hypothetical protein
MAANATSAATAVLRRATPQDEQRLIMGPWSHVARSVIRWALRSLGLARDGSTVSIKVLWASAVPPEIGTKVECGAQDQVNPCRKNKR